MIILIAGDTHTGKTLLAQKLMETLKMPYLSIDHLKMGLIRSAQTKLTPISDEGELTAYLWEILHEIIKTNLENQQNLIIEGCYIPFDFANSFTEEQLKEIHYLCLIFSQNYMQKYGKDIFAYENAIENRGYPSDFSLEDMLAKNISNLEMCQKHDLNYLLIDEKYDVQSLVNQGLEMLHKK